MRISRIKEIMSLSSPLNQQRNHCETPICRQTSQTIFRRSDFKEYCLYLLIIIKHQLMKAKVQKISLHKLLSAYSNPNLLQEYKEHPQQLKQQLTNLMLILDYVGAEHSSQAIEKRKKTNEYLGYSRNISEEVGRIGDHFTAQKMFGSKNEFLAFEALSFTQFQEEQYENEIDITRELKLKFLESKEVELSDWKRMFNPDGNLLQLKAEEVIVKLSLSPSPQTGQMEWYVKQVTYKSIFHNELTHFFYSELNDALIQKLGKQQSQAYFISNMKKALDKIDFILIYVNLQAHIFQAKNAAKMAACLRKKKEQSGNHAESLRPFTLSFDKASNQFDENALFWTYSWEFNFLSRKTTHATLTSDGHKLATLKWSSPHLFGELNLKWKNTLQQKMSETLCCCRPIKDAKNLNLVDFSTQISKHAQTMQRFYHKYGTLHCQHTLFAIYHKEMWLPNKLLAYQVEVPTKKDGLYFYVKRQLDQTAESYILKLEPNLMVSTEKGITGLVNMMMDRNVDFELILKHLYLQKKLTDCLEFEFKFSSFRIIERRVSKEVVFCYEFKQPMKYNSSIIETYKLAKTGRMEDPLSQQVNDIFKLRTEISLDFKRAYFSYSRNNELSYYDINEPYFYDEEWRAYSEAKQAEQVLDCQKLLNCMVYLCKHYLIQRVFHHRTPVHLKSKMLFKLT